MLGVGGSLTKRDTKQLDNLVKKTGSVLGRRLDPLKTLHLESPQLTEEINAESHFYPLPLPLVFARSCEG